MGCRFFTIWPQFIYQRCLHQSHSLSLKPAIPNIIHSSNIRLIHISVIQHMSFPPPDMVLHYSESLFIWKIPINLKDSDEISLILISMLPNAVCIYLEHTIVICSLSPLLGSVLIKIFAPSETNGMPGVRT